MLIQSKKNQDNTHEIDIETWEKMKEIGISRRFKVISTAEYEPSKKVPVEVRNFMNDEPEIKVKKVYEKEATMDEDAESDIKDEDVVKPKRKYTKKKIETNTENDE